LGYRSQAVMAQKPVAAEGEKLRLEAENLTDIRSEGSNSFHNCHIRMILTSVPMVVVVAVGFVFLAASSLAQPQLSFHLAVSRRVALRKFLY